VIRFSDIPVDSFLGKTLRKVLSIVPKNWVVPILQGPLKGTRWIVGAQLHGMWLGSFEVEKQHAISKMLRPGQAFYDIGANAGFYTLLGSKIVGPSGKVVAVEPLPRNVDVLRKHLSINGISNVRVVEKAVSDKNGKAKFIEQGYLESRLDEKGSLDVEATTFDRLIEETRLPPDFVKVDIEGAEVDLLRGAKTALRKYRPVFFMAIHSRKIFIDLSKIVREFSYAIRDLDGKEMTDADYNEEVILAPIGFPTCRVD
jgi:FkbM family methyltransferase